MKTILEVKNIAKSFEEKHVHKDVNFKLHKGETLGLLGHSGTGKSVLLRSLIGLERPDKGEIFYHDQRIDGLQEEELFPIRTKISYAFQNAALFDSYSVFENIAFPIMAHRPLSEADLTTRVDELLKFVNMDNTDHLMPSDLSGGMQKRIGLARAIALDPEIILYDEPTAGLDPINVEMVLELMKKFQSRGCSGILVTHDIMAAKKVCDRFLILREGVIYFEGSLSDFENSKDEFVQTFWTE